MEDFWLITVLAFVGFMILAALLLIPVWKFLGREEDAAEIWNKEVAERRAAQRVEDESASDA